MFSFDLLGMVSLDLPLSIKPVLGNWKIKAKFGVSILRTIKCFWKENKVLAGNGVTFIPRLIPTYIDKAP